MRARHTIAMIAGFSTLLFAGCSGVSRRIPFEFITEEPPPPLPEMPPPRPAPEVPNGMPKPPPPPEQAGAPADSEPSVSVEALPAPEERRAPPLGPAWRRLAPQPRHPFDPKRSFGPPVVTLLRIGPFRIQLPYRWSADPYNPNATAYPSPFPFR